MLKKQNWQAFSSRERHRLIDDIKDVILSSDGYISHFQFYADLAMSLTAVAPEMNLIQLHNRLSAIMKVTGLDESKINSSSDREWHIFLNITFSKGKGKLSEEIPMVPG